MKLLTKKLLIPAAIAASIAVSVPAFVGADFDLNGLNNQVQNHETRINKLENATPSPSPDPTSTTVEPGPGTTSAQSPQTPGVTGSAANVGSAEAPAPSSNVVVTPAPTPAPTPYYCPQNGQGNTVCGLVSTGVGQ